MAEREVSPRQPSKELQSFVNPKPTRDYIIRFECPEFTCLCPLTNQPDFATFVIEYTPAARCIESKSLKLYLWSYRNEGAFHEAVTNQILDDLVAACEPSWMKITGRFMVRGGISADVIAEHRSKV